MKSNNWTLQPMDTAPKDGSEVLIVLNAAYASWSDSNRILARWNASISEWDEGDGVSHEDSACVGWLDIEAAQRDSERLTKLIELLNFGATVDGLFDEAEVAAAECEGDSEDYQKWIRAAIDKEMGNA